MDQNIIRQCHECSLPMLEMKSTEKLNSFLFVKGMPDIQGEKKHHGKLNSAHTGGRQISPSAGALISQSSLYILIAMRSESSARKIDTALC